MGDIIKREMAQLLEDVESTTQYADEMSEQCRLLGEELESLGIFKEEYYGGHRSY